MAWNQIDLLKTHKITIEDPNQIKMLLIWMNHYQPKIKIPEKYMQAKLSDFKKEYSEALSKKESLLIQGTIGSGKTHLLCAMTRHITEEHLFKKFISKSIPGEALRVRYVSFPDLLNAIRNSFTRESNQNDYINILQFMNYLFLDDIGAESTTEWTNEILYRILDSRINDNLPTVVSSNLSLAEIKKWNGDRIASRISGFRGLKLDGIDRRLKKSV